MTDNTIRVRADITDDPDAIHTDDGGQDDQNVVVPPPPQNPRILRTERQRQYYGDRVHQKDRGFGPHKLLDRHDNLHKCGQQSQGLRPRMALRNSGDVGLDSGLVNMDKFEAPISETIRHPD